jgi:hypothetical protein
MDVLAFTQKGFVLSFICLSCTSSASLVFQEGQMLFFNFVYELCVLHRLYLSRGIVCPDFELYLV